MSGRDTEAAGLIVRGTRGMTEWKSLVLDGVANKVVHHATLPGAARALTSSSASAFRLPQKVHTSEPKVPLTHPGALGSL